MTLKPVQAFKCPQGHTEVNPVRAMAFCINHVMRDKDLGETVSFSAALKLLEKRNEIRAMFDELDKFLETGLIEPELMSNGVPALPNVHPTIKNGGIGGEDQQRAERMAELEALTRPKTPPVDAISDKHIPLYTGVDRRVPRMDGDAE